MEGIKDYQEYEHYFSDDLVKICRTIMQKAEDFKYEENGFRDSREHGELIKLFNKFGLHKKLNPKEFENWEREKY